MKTKQEVYDFLRSLQWQRFTKSELKEKLSYFFNKDMSLEDGTDPDDKELDYSFISTTGDYNSVSNFIDIEIWYAKTRHRNHFIVTGTELLDYQL